MTLRLWLAGRSGAEQSRGAAALRRTQSTLSPARKLKEVGDPWGPTTQREREVTRIVLPKSLPPLLLCMDPMGLYPHGPWSFTELGLKVLPLGTVFPLCVHGRCALVPGCRTYARGMKDTAAVDRLAFFLDACAGVWRGRVGPPGPGGCVCATVLSSLPK